MQQIRQDWYNGQAYALGGEGGLNGERSRMSTTVFLCVGMAAVHLISIALWLGLLRHTPSSQG